jgi:hypothetical protein
MSTDSALTVPTRFVEAERLPDAQLIMYPDSNHGAHYQHAEVFLKHAKLFLSA